MAQKLSILKQCSKLAPCARFIAVMETARKLGSRGRPNLRKVYVLEIFITIYTCRKMVEPKCRMVAAMLARCCEV